MKIAFTLGVVLLLVSLSIGLATGCIPHLLHGQITPSAPPPLQIPVSSSRESSSAAPQLLTTVQPIVSSSYPAPTTPVPPQMMTYTIQPGDRLWNLAEYFYGDGHLWYNIAEANGIDNPNHIYPGDVLVIPDLSQ